MRVLTVLSLSLALMLGRGAAAGPAADDAGREAAARLIGTALVSDTAYDRLAYLCDRFGHRLSGSETLEAAIDWAGSLMKADGLVNVREEEVMVPVWVRGRESAELLEPTPHRLSMLGLGRSVATPPAGIEAEVVVVESFDDLERRGRDGIEGKIVLYDVPFTTYGETVKYRGSGASRAAVLGAVAALVRSVGPDSYDTPHTGALNYDEDKPKIPAAAISIENATMLHRMQDRGERIRLRLKMEAATLPDRPSANLVAEVRGRELPDEIVLLGGHIDSWDVGQGAQDDGAGCLIAWEAARLIHALGLTPRRTIRVVLFTNEENGLEGAKAYAKAHAAELNRHVAAIESDSGNGLAAGFGFQMPIAPAVQKEIEALKGEARAKRAEEEKNKACAGAGAAVKAGLEEIGKLLAPLGATTMTCGGSGADVSQVVKEGVLGMGLDHDITRYFDIHHTWADTFDKIDRNTLNKNVAIMAVMAWALAEMPERLLPPPEAAPSGAR